MTEKHDTRCQIIEAARKRFSHFGYAKTTMAEVAADCSMSPGNLYRFFPGKLDIAECISTQDYEKHLVALREIAVATGRSAADRLRDFLFAELRRTYHKLESDPRAYEMATVIKHERPEYANWMLANERRILVELFEDAERGGEYYIEDKEITAEMIQSATMKFRYPQLWSKLTLPKLERELDGVLNLIIRGLPRARSEQPANEVAA
jgi:AcrR family transcriptional regulator